MAPLDPGCLTCCMNLRWGSRTHCPGTKGSPPPGTPTVQVFFFCPQLTC